MSHPREGEVLLELFAVTLGGSKELHASLVDCVLSLTAAAAKWQDAGASPEECLKLAQPLSKALGNMKQTVTALEHGLGNFTPWAPALLDMQEQHVITM